MDRKLATALVVYGILATLAALTLDGVVRIVTLVFLAGLALKTYIGILIERGD